MLPSYIISFLYLQGRCWWIIFPTTGNLWKKEQFHWLRTMVTDWLSDFGSYFTENLSIRGDERFECTRGELKGLHTLFKHKGSNCACEQPGLEYAHSFECARQIPA